MWEIYAPIYEFISDSDNEYWSYWICGSCIHVNMWLNTCKNTIDYAPIYNCKLIQLYTITYIFD